MDSLEQIKKRAKLLKENNLKGKLLRWYYIILDLFKNGTFLRNYDSNEVLDEKILNIILDDDGRNFIRMDFYMGYIGGKVGNLSVKLLEFWNENKYYAWLCQGFDYNSSYLWEDSMPSRYVSYLFQKYIEFKKESD